MGIRAVVRGALSSPSEAMRKVNAAQLADEETGLRAMLRRLDERYPELSRWVGGRLDIEVPAIFVSVSVHVVLLIVLATVGYAVKQQVNHEFQSKIDDTPLRSDLSAKVDFQDLLTPEQKPTSTPAAGSFAPNLAPSIISAPPSAALPPADVKSQSTAGPQLAALDINRATQTIMPTASVLGENISIKGNGAEHVGGVDGAVDRIAEEILRHLEKGRTLVIWAFDASGSLVAERERLSKHIESVYSHVLQLDEKGLNQDDGLLTMVVAFGHDRKAMTPVPTADKNAIISAINSVPLDNTGIETTFGTVADIVHKWGHFKASNGNFYHPMIVVVTDEVGDDESRLEEAIQTASRAKVPVYVLGSPALFGRRDGFMNYTDPKTKQTFYHLPVRQGPESIEVEQIKLPFWYTGYQYDMLNSGFGPYALSRLANATGGIYFITRMGENRMGFDSIRMQEYKPDWQMSRAQYEVASERNPIRAAVLEAAKLTQQRMGPQPSLFFPSIDSPNFKEVMAANQEKAALTTNAVDDALKPISAAAEYRDHEKSRRWQAHYDLIRGRLLAMKIRCYEYNWACATMKKDQPKFKNAQSNAWKLVPSDEIRYSDKAKLAAKQAKVLLKRVITEHPNTPWSLLAQRELKDPFGFDWVETYVKPVERPKESAEAKAKKEKAKANMPKPAEVPKL